MSFHTELLLVLLSVPSYVLLLAFMKEGESSVAVWFKLFTPGRFRVPKEAMQIASSVFCPLS